MALARPADAIASRSYDLHDEAGFQKIIAAVGPPLQLGDHGRDPWTCSWLLQGARHHSKGTVIGADSLHALLLALSTVKEALQALGETGILRMRAGTSFPASDLDPGPAADAFLNTLQDRLDTSRALLQSLDRETARREQRNRDADAWIEERRQLWAEEVAGRKSLAQAELRQEIGQLRQQRAELQSEITKLELDARRLGWDIDRLQSIKAELVQLETQRQQAEHELRILSGRVVALREVVTAPPPTPTHVGVTEGRISPDAISCNECGFQNPRTRRLCGECGKPIRPV